MNQSLTRPLMVLAVAVAAITMLGIPAHATYGARVTADEPQYLLSALSLGRDGDLDISNQIEQEAYRTFHRVDLDPQTIALDDSGRQISPHDPALPVMLALPMRWGGWVAAKATLAVMAAVLAALTAWVAVRRFGISAPVAIAVVAVFSCTSPLATYGTQVYPEIPAALTTMVAVAALTGAMRRRGLLVAAFAIVLLPWLSVKYAPVAAALAAVALWELRRRAPTAWRFAGGLALMGAVYLVAHRLIYGGWTAYASGDYFASASGEGAVVGTDPNYLGRARRLVGLLVDDGFGLAAWMPAWFVLPFALGFLARHRPRGWLAVAAPLAIGWLVATFVALTMHGWWWPGRQVVVVLPLGVIAIAFAAQTVRWVRVFVAVGAVLGLLTWVWTTVEAIFKVHVLVVDFDRTGNPWMGLWRLVLPDGRSPTTGDEWLLAIWLAAVVVMVWRGWNKSSSFNLPKTLKTTYTVS